MVLSRNYQAQLTDGTVVSHPVARMPVTSESGSMSDNSETSFSGDASPGDKPDDICRDYLRNVCKRGKRCKYRHPDSNEAQVTGRRQDYTFCHDYQNSGCRRHNCRFLHCTREEENYYKQTGQLPARLQQAAALGIGVMANDVPLLKGEVPVCKDFLKGQCMRGARCKYRHITPPQYEVDLPQKERVRNGSTDILETINGDGLDRYTSSYDAATAMTVVVAAAKRRRTEDTYNGYTFQRTVQTPVDYTGLLEEENTILRRKVDELKKHVSDLAATNEVLLEQNARFRASKNSTLLSTVPPIVTVSQVVTPTITPAPAMARPAMPHHPQSLATLTAPPQLTVNANSELVVSQTTIQGTINPPVSVAINPVTQNMVPVSLTMDTSIAPPGSIAAHIATVSMPQSIVAPPVTSHYSARTLIGSVMSTPLVSYPIMSHCVTQLPTSSLG